MTAARLILLALLLGLVTLAVTAATGGLSPSLIEPDEAGHYVNALFLGDWIRAGFPSPMAFARDFYAHFPRLSIGHWPPGWYMVEAPLFALFRPSPQAAAIGSALLAGLPGIAILWAFARLGRSRLGLGLALAYALLPLTLDGARYILVDQPLALMVALAAIAWHAAIERPTWPRMLVFALLAAACPLVKGNGALIALVPALDIALTRRWSLLRRPPLWGAAALTFAIVAPWYAVSFRISAEGFNYQPGLGYAWLALRDNFATILANIGWGGVLLAVIGAASSDKEARLARLALAVVLATLLFQSAVPASLVPRYCAPLLPWAVILAGLGLLRLARLGRDGVLAGSALAAAALTPSLLAVAALAPKPDLAAPALADTMTQRGGLWLVDGRSGAEGAVIAAAAYADNGRRRVWVARASQWLSTSDFMGRGYRLTARTPAEARAVLDRLGAAGAVSVAIDGRLAYPHSRVLLAGLHDPAYAIVARRFRVGEGRVTLARRLLPITPNAALLAADPMSAKVGKMAGALD
jgi:4-amino-4-deoxy-L-arabinose transferase-like glycosyltransferase